MTYYKINLKNPDQKVLAAVAAACRQQAVIVYPTDTIYGLGCRADKTAPISRVKKIKKRDPQKPLIVIVSSLNMAKKFCFISRQQEDQLKKIWSGCRPTTVVLRRRPGLPAALAPGKKTLAVRLPKNDFLRKMVRMVGVPLVSTSFNLSGQPVKNEVHFLAERQEYPGDPDLVLDGGRRPSRASRIIDLTGEQAVILRS